MLAQEVLADTSPTVALRWVWIIVVVAAVLTIARLYMLRAASSRKIHPDRRNDQDNHRGMEQGGVYTYTPGMFSHSYPPSKETQPEEFRRDNPQPGREPKKPWPDGILYEQTVFKQEFEELKKSTNPDTH
ncbi:MULTISPECIES: hypothetical protein [Actinomadura]|uniref:Uncharacterized protein n=1 Tax=Actinomadura madurae TaxID=1993 RepID=A0A1I5G4H4_9ACTN|nr:hypothetical protein [Actinomadura madurae]SFO30935.1 hypothetical protein SAMN04489713_10532 [Actinomadura madurae]SPT50989.1 Uncharacterised protein [Actinomadura madurae]